MSRFDLDSFVLGVLTGVMLLFVLTVILLVSGGACK